MMEDHQVYQQRLALHKDFYAMPTPDLDYVASINWPKPQGIVGKATKIGYWSNKFDGKWREYIHAHKKPYPTVVRQFCKEDGDKPNRNFWKMPRPPVWSFLGFALDLQIDRGRGFEFFDWKSKGKKNLPYLGWDENRKMLIVQPLNNDPPILLHSRILKVTQAGIEN
jgi:hypothetical protein